ncbi:hypothetical protein OH76DRAFT_399038 [Lentinus brumalis]|uniref:Uncharacterized protein n=1 Tax=Lentinus brumalis TaxID=2498619 RepID=A0A371DVQ4_9APHY|nr:hypothetical protein OH76DRAFT_399038 [Polyporus brumalis]
MLWSLEWRIVGAKQHATKVSKFEGAQTTPRQYAGSARKRRTRIGRGDLCNLAATPPREISDPYLELTRPIPSPYITLSSPTAPPFQPYNTPPSPFCEPHPSPLPLASSFADPDVS